MGLTVLGDNVISSFGAATYVIYGSDTVPETFNLSSLNGTNGFKIVGQNMHYNLGGASLS